VASEGGFCALDAGGALGSGRTATARAGVLAVVSERWSAMSHLKQKKIPVRTW